MGTRAVMVTGATSSANSGAAAGGLQASTVAARLFSVTVYNGSGAKAYVQVHDSAGTPAVNAVAKLTANVPSDSQVSFDYGDGRICSTGIFIGLSTSSTQFASVDSTDSLIDCTYRRI